MILKRTYLAGRRLKQTKEGIRRRLIEKWRDFFSPDFIQTMSESDYVILRYSASFSFFLSFFLDYLVSENGDSCNVDGIYRLIIPIYLDGCD
jgi:hypothetical protein